MTKSTLNSKLAKPSLVSAYTNVSQGKRATKFYTNENGTMTLRLGLRQVKGRKARYQFQIRWHFRYTGTVAKTKGANWATWTTWRTPVAIAASKTLPAIPANSAKDPNTWQRANKGANASGDYCSLYNVSVAIGSSYDAVCYQIRARQYDYASNKHSSWVYSDNIFVCRSPEVVDETLTQAEDGALDIDYNFKWDRGRTLYVTSVKDAAKREILKSTYKAAPKLDSKRSANTVPAKRSGYLAGTNTVPVGSLKRKVLANEVLTVNAYLATGDGAKTYFVKPLTVNGNDADLAAPVVKVQKDDGRGLLAVDVYKGDADDDLDKVGCSVTWSYNGKDYTAECWSSTVDTTVADTATPVGKFWFVKVPVGLTLVITATLRNSYKKTKSTKAKTVVGTPETAYVNPARGAQDNVAQAFGNMSFDITSTPPVTIELPYGRTSQFAAYGKGLVTTMTLKASISESASATHPRAVWRWWNAVRTNQGVYVLRLPDGQMYTVAVTEVGASQARNGVREVTLYATEVS